MTDASVWSAVRALAHVWRQSTNLQRFSSQLPQNAAQRSEGLPGALQDFIAGGAPIAEEPLRSAEMLYPFLAMGQKGIELQANSEFREWWELAVHVQSAHDTMLAWIRSRIPDHPRILAPHLATGTPFTTKEFTWRVPWRNAESSAGLHEAPAPPGLALLLNLSPKHEQEAVVAAATLSRSLALTPQWTRFSSAAKTLDASSHDLLKAAQFRLAESLTDTAVAAHEPAQSLRRLAFRASALRQETESLTGCAKEYSDAFSEVNDLIDLSVSEVFGQLACYWSIQAIGTVEELEFRPGEQDFISFQPNSTLMPELGQLALLDDALVPDVVQFKEVEMNYDSANGLRWRVVARVLRNSRAALTE